MFMRLNHTGIDLGAYWKPMGGRRLIRSGINAN